jgi:shikimate dehydrogenase
MRKAGVVGWPIAHSRSPLIHGHWLHEHGLEGSYERIPVEPAAADGFFATFADSGFVGCNVTLPYKEVAAGHARHLEPVAARLGAANTLWLDDGRLCATNTDVEGFLGNLDAAEPGWDADPSVSLVLGAGGAAKAVVDGLVERGFTVRVANRTLARAEDLARRYPGRATAHLLSESNRFVPEAALIVNTTSVGMKGEGELDLELDRAAPESIAADIVYVPLETPFLKRAAAAGLRTVDGLGMLLHQAIPGFERWFGIRPTVTPELRARVEADL